MLFNAQVLNENYKKRVELLIRLWRWRIKREVQIYKKIYFIRQVFFLWLLTYILLN